MISEEESKYDEKKLPVTGQHIQESPSRLRVLKPKIDLKKCEKNYNCHVFCPTNAISLNKDGYPAINYDLCNGCLICLRECPVFAITEEHEKRMPKI